MEPNRGNCLVGHDHSSALVDPGRLQRPENAYGSHLPRFLDRFLFRLLGRERRRNVNRDSTAFGRRRLDVVTEHRRHLGRRDDDTREHAFVAGDRRARLGDRGVRLCGQAQRLAGEDQPPLGLANELEVGRDRHLVLTREPGRNRKRPAVVGERLVQRGGLGRRDVRANRSQVPAHSVNHEPLQRHPTQLRLGEAEVHCATFLDGVRKPAIPFPRQLAAHLLVARDISAADQQAALLGSVGPGDAGKARVVRQRTPP